MYKIVWCVMFRCIYKKMRDIKSELSTSGDIFSALVWILCNTILFHCSTSRKTRFTDLSEHKASVDSAAPVNLPVVNFYINSQLKRQNCLLNLNVFWFSFLFYDSKLNISGLRTSSWSLGNADRHFSAFSDKQTNNWLINWLINRQWEHKTAPNSGLLQTLCCRHQESIKDQCSDSGDKLKTLYWHSRRGELTLVAEKHYILPLTNLFACAGHTEASLLHRDCFINS